jgi:hypothetical protein
MSVLAAIAVAVVALLAVIAAFGVPVPPLPNEAQAAGYRIGRLIAMLGIPLLIAYPIAGRRSWRRPNLFAGLFCGISLLFVISTAMNPIGFETTDQQMSRLMREAAGLQPVRKPLFGENKRDTQFRNFFRDLININKEYQQSVDALDISETAKLSTSASFADPDSVSVALRQLHAAYDVDALQEQRMSAALEKFKQGFNDLPASERDEMLTGFNQGLAKVMPKRQRAVSTEKAWLDSLDDIYAYAQSYHSSFGLSDGRLIISDSAVREEFNNRVRTLNARRTEFLQAKNEFDQLQRENLQKIGITRQDTGLH